MNNIDKMINDLNLTENDKKTAKKVLNKYWSLIGKDLKQLVKSAHSKPKIYQNNYGYYLGLVTSLNESGIYGSLAGMLLILAGADPEGIKSAFKIINN